MTDKHEEFYEYVSSLIETFASYGATMLMAVRRNDTDDGFRVEMFGQGGLHSKEEELAAIHEASEQALQHIISQNN